MTTALLARLAYGAAFVLGVPALLVMWAAGTADVIPLPALHAPIAGTVVAGAGLLFMASGMGALVRRGGGLPMNAFPPPRYVATGIYRYTADPIYIGFVAMVAGAALVTGSASALWLVTPVTALCAAALVFGYERHDLRRRFGTLVRTRLSLPDASDTAPSVWERIAVLVTVLLPWLLLYEAVHLLGVPADAFDVRLPFERGLPVLEWTEVVYASAYILVPLAVLLAPTGTALRRFAVAGLTATVAITLLYILLPAVSPPRAFVPTTLPGRLLAMEQAHGSTVAAFPAFHVVWALLAADVWRGRRIARAVFTWALLIAASCMTTGMHGVADVAFAFVCFFLLRRAGSTWGALRDATERFANSWREWRVGRVRIINHGVYAGMGAAFGLAVGATAAGHGLLGAMLLASLAAVAGAGLWAQWLEGSPQLLRPFGYYGGVAGGVLGTLVAGLTGAPVMTLLGAFALAAPWVQAFGRLRCLVQGCCHGGPAPPHVGIRYRHPRSRVSRVPGHAGAPLHPTPLYSIIANAITGVMLLRLWSLGASPALALGLYFILNGAARFVEESYRAEPQTPVLAGLRVYQWLAAASVLAGIAVTMIPSAPWPAPAFTRATAAAALGLGAIVAFAMGVDFPTSNRRFSRLADVDPLDPLDPDPPPASSPQPQRTAVPAS